MIKSPRTNPLVSSGLLRVLTLNNFDPTGISLNYGNTGYGVSKLEMFLPQNECPGSKESLISFKMELWQGAIQKLRGQDFDHF